MKNDLDVAKTLIRKADNDLRVARIGIEHDAPLDTLAFHIQQAAEKMLKALLASRGFSPNRKDHGCRCERLSASRSRGVRRPPKRLTSSAAVSMR
jgi:HEPN domain-containing protein